MIGRGPRGAGQWRYVLALSLSSRALLLLIQWLANIAIQDHNADAYTNKYRPKLDARNTPLLMNNAHQYNTTNGHYSLATKVIHGALGGLTNWDSQYFLHITLHGYTQPHAAAADPRHLAFMPLFPVLVAATKRLVPFWAPTSDTEDYAWTVLLGIALNNLVLFPLAALSLFQLTKEVVSKDDRYARQVVAWFCFNPASIFFSAYYSESLFSALAFSTMRLLEISAKPSSNTKTSHNKSALKLYLPGLLVAALCSVARSNGLLLIGYVYFHILVDKGFISRRLQILRSPTIVIKKLLSIVPTVIISTSIAVSPYVLFQVYSRDRICSTEERPDWCDNIISHPYSWLQAKYWNVGLFKYYTLKQIPNFLLATPITLLVLLNSVNRQKIKKLPLKQVPYYLHGVALTIFCVLIVNVQVTTRIIASSCPIVYWICADLSGKQTRRLVILYFAAYFLIGTILHSNFYPWT